MKIQKFTVRHTPPSHQDYFVFTLIMWRHVYTVLSARERSPPPPRCPTWTEDCRDLPINIPMCIQILRLCKFSTHKQTPAHVASQSVSQSYYLSDQSSKLNVFIFFVYNYYFLFFFDFHTHLHSVCHVIIIIINYYYNNVGLHLLLLIDIYHSVFITMNFFIFFLFTFILHGQRAAPTPNWIFVRIRFSYFLEGINKN